MATCTIPRLCSLVVKRQPSLSVKCHFWGQNKSESCQNKSYSAVNWRSRGIFYFFFFISIIFVEKSQSCTTITVNWRSRVRSPDPPSRAFFFFIFPFCSGVPELFLDLVTSIFHQIPINFLEHQKKAFLMFSSLLIIINECVLLKTIERGDEKILVFL